jgi:hypothetical protein
MLPTLIWNILLLIPVVMVLVVPCISALFSKRVHGVDRILWALASLLLSWLGYFVFYYFRVRNKQMAP